MSIRNVLLLVVMAMVEQGCTTDGAAKKLDDDGFKAKGNSSDGQIGLNDKNQILIKSETSVSQELNIQQAVNMHHQEKLEGELIALKYCRSSLADPRLGGDGQVKPVPDIDSMRPATEVREQLGLDDNGDIKIVKSESYQEKLKGERAFEASLKQMLKLTVNHREDCENRMGQARMKAGLSPKRYQGEGYFTSDGTWVQTSQHENSLDDAFAIAAKMKQKSETPSH